MHWHFGPFPWTHSNMKRRMNTATYLKLYAPYSRKLTSFNPGLNLDQVCVFPNTDQRKDSD